VSSTFLTLIVVPVLYTVLHVSLPGAFDSVKATLGGIRVPATGPGIPYWRQLELATLARTQLYKG